MNEEMETTDSGLKFNLPKNKSSVIKVIGVGGGGSNAVNHMQMLGIKDTDYIICNTDSQALEHSEITNKIQLGASLTEGLGAGANPNVGKKAAIESLTDIKSILENNTKMLFITAGMGGGTGTGAAPIIAKLSKEMGLLTVAVVTMPFPFEGAGRMKQAEDGLKELKPHVDSLIVIKNEKLREVYGNMGYKKGFKKADSVLGTAVKVIAEVITNHYLANIDLQDARKVLANSGTAIMGSAVAEGDNRAIQAVTAALDSPLLNDNHINGAKNVLLLVVSGNEDHEITMDEIAEINEHIQKEAGGDTNIILGIGDDESLNEKVNVTVIATGFEGGNNPGSPTATSTAPGKIKIPLGAEIEEAIEEVPEEINPLTTPINGNPKKNKHAVNPIGQTDLFTAIEQREAEREKENRKNKIEEVVNELDETDEEEENLFPEDFQEESNPNEIIFEVTKNIEKAETIEEEINIDSFAQAEDTVFDTEVESEEEVEETTFSLDDHEEEINISEIAETNIKEAAVEIKQDEIDSLINSNEENNEVNNISEISTPTEEVKETVGIENNTLEIESETEEKSTFILEDDTADETIFDLPKSEIKTEESKELDFELDTNSFTILDEFTEDEIEEPKSKEPVSEETIDPLNFSIAEINEFKSASNEFQLDEIEETPIPHTAESSEEPTKHTLEDLQSLEKLLGVKSQATKDTSVETEGLDESLQFEVKTVSKTEIETLPEEVSPVEDDIKVACSKKRAERANRLSKFNHRWLKSSTESEEPAYKRMGIEIQNNGISDENNLSRMTVNGDGKETNIQSSNSFLHDNVD